MTRLTLHADGYVVAVRDGSFSDTDGTVHRVKAGMTRFSRDDADLGRPEVAALFGFSRSATTTPDPDWYLE